MTRNSVRQFAIVIAATIFTVLTAFLGPWVQSHGGKTGVVIAVLISVVGLTGLIALFEYLLLRFWARGFLGQWVYQSNSITIDPRGHFGYVRFFVRNGEIRYNVQIYKLEAIWKLINGDRTSGALAVGSATAEVVIFNGEDRIKILYNYTPLQSSGGGLGVLDITSLLGQSMTGSWVTARVSEAPDYGKQKWYRPEFFLDYLESEFPEEVVQLRAGTGLK